MPTLKPIINLKYTLVILCLTFGLLIRSHWTFDDDDDAHFNNEPGSHEEHSASSNHQEQPMPKDKILLKNVKTLTFYRNKRTTSRRTHTIHQLSCVGGTAGCKLFTPDKVECENVASANEKTTINKINWRCHAEMSERVQFNHVEVICEGYDYPEDDYILLGSCGLEFTLDYTDPHDYHDNSYFKHMDEHEKELHHDRVRKKLSSEQQQRQSSMLAVFYETILTNRTLLIGSFILTVAILFIMVKYCSSNSGERQQHGYIHSNRTTKKPVAGRYGPITSAVLTTKKAC